MKNDVGPWRSLWFHVLREDGRIDPAAAAGADRQTAGSGFQADY